MTQDLLFPLGGPRLTTILFIAVFLSIAITREEKKPALACAAWLFGFEAVFEAAAFGLGRQAALGPIHAAIYMAVGVILVPWFARQGVRPSLPLLIAALAVFAAWVGTGFHVNEHTMVDFDPLAEVLNEVSKTLWALAYLLPVVWQRQAGSVDSAVARSVDRVNPDSRIVSVPVAPPRL